MDTSIRLYTTNGGLRSVMSEARTGQPTAPLPEEDNGCVEVASNQEKQATETLSAAVTVPREEVQGVDVADFEAIFVRFQTPITNFIYHLIGNREQAADLAQDVFVKAYRALLSGTVVQPGALSAWLYRIAQNTTTDALRRRRLISWLPLSLFNEDRGIGAGVLSDAGSSSSDSFNSNDSSSEGRSSAVSAIYGGYDGGRFEGRVADREIVEHVMKQLPPKYAVCLWLYENNGFSCAEIADMLTISASAVKMRLMRARERFIALYRQEVGDE
ncbi:MAG: RNA polymerase sigma factor [Ktedonobacteraceae bacterium]